MRYFFLATALLLAGNTCQQPENITVTAQDSGVMASLRGLDVVNPDVAWASGSDGTVLRTTDGGKRWLNVSPAGADSLDFRDIEASSATEALILTAGYPGLILQTVDGGEHWRLAYEDYRADIFFDAMDFRDKNSGMAFGDAIDGRVVILVTNDGGNSWQQLPGPQALPNEGGFAASGTCIVTGSPAKVWIAMGTPAARVLFSANNGQTWQAVATPMAQEATGAGIFSLAFNSATYGIAVGGNYTRPDDTTKTIARTQDGGQTWELLPGSGINGYKSAVAPIPGSKSWLATGPTGISCSTDNGLSWNTIDSTGYHTVAMANGTTGWLTGARGKIAKITIR